MIQGLVLLEFMPVVIPSRFIITKGLRKHERLARAYGNLERFCSLCVRVL